MIDIHVVVVVVGELSQCKIGIPATAEIQDTRPQHILHVLDGPLALTIRLQVKNGAKLQTSTQIIVKLLLESGSEPYVSV